MALASTFNDHMILVGCGHLGYRVVIILHEMYKDVVVIDSDPRADLIEIVRALGIPVIQDDATREVILEAS
jgi:Trk K+ transport system NAD-binding subunit